MRQMYDALDPNGIPADAQYVGFYIDQISEQEAALRWPGKGLLSIARNHLEDAACADCESTDLTPTQCPAWVARQRARGVRFPWVYCSVSPLPNVQVAFRVQGVAPPLYWIAQPGATGLYPGSVATQYAFKGAYDVSWLADEIPGFDLEDDGMGLEAISTGSGLYLVAPWGGYVGVSDPANIADWKASGRIRELTPETFNALMATRPKPEADGGSAAPATLTVSLTGTVTPEAPPAPAPVPPA